MVEACCIRCRSKMKRWAFTASGTQRWRCVSCYTTCSSSSGRGYRKGTISWLNSSDGRAILKAEKFQEAKSLYLQGFSIRKVVQRVGLSPVTAHRYRNLALTDSTVLCVCGKLSGHKGWCDWRISQSPSRQSYLAICAAQSSATRLARISRVREVPLICWPYLRNLDHPEYRLIRLVNDALPRSLPDHIRADVGQEILAEVIAGSLSENDLGTYAKLFIKRIWNQQQSRFREISLDAFIGNQDRKLEELIAA